jgi:DNA-binding CsgD family transcriptional regulator
VSQDLKQDRRAGGDRRTGGGLHLTARERDVLELVLRGAANKEIAQQLGLREPYAKELVSHLLRKFEVANRAALVEAGLRLDLVGESVARRWLPQLLREAAVQIAVTSGPEHRYVFVNAAFAAAVGRDVLGRTMREGFPELASGAFDAADRVYRTGESTVAHEAVAVWDRGRGPERLYTDAVLQPLRGDEGQIEGLVFFGMDVTEHVRARSAESSD